MFTNLDNNPNPPFMVVVRQPEVKYGTNPSTIYTIPNRKQFYYAVPTWNGNQEGVDVYTIPQPVPVDINYSVKIICNRIRELNQLNKIVMQKFSSRQAYTFIKGQYIPIISTSISDESQLQVDSRKYFIQNYDFTMLGYLIDEDEFEVKPGITRFSQIFEIDTRNSIKKKKSPDNNDKFLSNFLYVVGNNILIETIDFTADMSFVSSNNITSYDVYINNIYYGSNVEKIQITTNNILKIQVVKNDESKESNIKFNTVLV